jgi:hypothetical protein
MSHLHSIGAVAAVSLLLSAAPASTRTYGAAVKVGNGEARSYVQYDEKTGAPTEVGIALTERALEGLPTAGSGHHGSSMMTHEFILTLPDENSTPFKFVEMNWNPAGHEPEGVYAGVPHFDFHFYTISRAARDSINPTDPNFAKKAENVPAKEYIPAFVAPIAPPNAKLSDVAVPMMGVHWADMRSPELQKLLGKPEANKPFTTTFLHGTWNGQVHFWEPMITHAFIVKKKATMDPAVRDQVIPLPLPAKYQSAGYYPGAYRITWDASAKEYRIALTQLAWRQ